MHETRQRYILFSYRTLDQLSSDLLKEKDIVPAIWRSFIQLFGDYNAYKVGLWLIDFDPITKHGILRCNNKTSEMLISALTYIDKIRDRKVIFHTLATSGTIKKLKKICNRLLGSDENR